MNDINGIQGTFGNSPASLPAEWSIPDRGQVAVNKPYINPLYSEQTQCTPGAFQSAAAFVFSIIEKAFSMFQGLLGMGRQPILKTAEEPSGFGKIISILGSIGGIFAGGPLGGVLGSLGKKIGGALGKIF